MNATRPRVDRTPSDAATPDSDAGTRQRVLQIVAADGPVSAAELAAAARPRARGRPSPPGGPRGHRPDHRARRRSRAPGSRTPGAPLRRDRRGQAALSHRYSEIASQALRFLAETAGPQAVAGLRGAAGSRPRAAPRRGRRRGGRRRGRARARPRRRARRRRLRRLRAARSPGGAAMQVLPGPLPRAGRRRTSSPQLCEAETRAFSRLLGVHVQRLSTLAAGGHVCTTSIPAISTHAPHAPAHPVLSVEGRSA